MFFRTFSLAFISTLVASGAWYAYKGDPNKPELSPTFIVNQTSPLFQQQTSSFYSTVTTPTAVGQNSDQSSSPALVVNNDQLSATSTASEEPISKQTSESGRKVVGMLTPEEATQKLRRSEESYFVGRGQGVVRYDMVQLPSNDPIEDDHAEKIVVTTREDGSSSDWMFWGVFDGHSGWTTSAKLRQALISFVTRELNSTYQKAGASVSGSIFPSPEAIDAAIKRGFVNLDNEIVHWSVDKVLKANSKRVAAELLAPALSGSCALLAFYDSQSSMLRVACTGDSRAVLGRRAANGKWTATPLSEDQTGSTESEIQRLRQEHPGEDNVVRNGRVLGNLEPTRAFGDAFYKWKRDTQDKIKRQFFGRTPHQYLKTPPYVTAEPVVTATQVDPQKGDFLVLATDGLWEMLSNDEVVGLVGQWLEHQRASAQGKDGVKGWLQSWWSQEGQLPIEKSVREDATGQRAPIRQLQYNIPQSETRFVIEDKNAATHLIRNALGGKDKDMMCALLTLPSPYSRRYRDDLTVQVIFFGESETTGNVTINSEASASGRTVPAKL
ncbi:[Pyruvate dehydrogenase [acetyl-transferring]]-phosphatase 1, mitochondrial [Ophidiomyces ophidiicola]|uniref:[Pyruvate dehydrogenase [acetyl-transferring]]-phosphatase 1, mitochondrial n=1 Tax=Ophidiomyces ophidiicola TaxID=1387563 RepID=A0ACB8UYW2_9EURO|nr:[Pyruvate dehydrogenase [acetyl-transferring]]-phosphatase 1, mitochondrial [Ophidiomyces ophidiicola]KAI1913887.1 [Pyruvate dehydrogenase [acetyl-transferring]]-phosphatase 1, mitochondrial [Ophidiomyces ophidiicola]KAI1916790.1 [Pyruvate dehydrogenase [acetyl-transferring]]-phosphatase 1, mitochondrial [Ophidiomyces ophidiicola]KAI1927874.1 [Pyruvate dehydrogenase [acetyl-transferring]]-phosphatase 1, mitochondrial [Ophidiomyces ophidiicola]KAI1948010.1 [Pyruvate dehydrogenase [acetyl-tran